MCSSTQCAEMLMMSAFKTAMMCSMNFAWFPCDTNMTFENTRQRIRILRLFFIFFTFHYLENDFLFFLSFEFFIWSLFGYTGNVCTKIQKPLTRHPKTRVVRVSRKKHTLWVMHAQTETPAHTVESVSYKPKKTDTMWKKKREKKIHICAFSVWSGCEG